jgi:hypothetical protein
MVTVVEITAREGITEKGDEITEEGDENQSSLITTHYKEITNFELMLFDHSSKCLMHLNV